MMTEPGIAINTMIMRNIRQRGGRGGEVASPNRPPVKDEIEFFLTAIFIVVFFFGGFTLGLYLMTMGFTCK